MKSARPIDPDLWHIDCDFCADGALWDDRGRAVRAEWFEFSPALCVAFRAWNAFYDQLHPERPDGFDFATFDPIGDALLALACAERPDLRFVRGMRNFDEEPVSP